MNPVWKFARGKPSIIGMYVARSVNVGHSPQRIALWFDGHQVTFLDGRLFGAGISIQGEWHTIDDLELAGPFVLEQSIQVRIVKSPSGTLCYGKCRGNQIIDYRIGEDWLNANVSFEGWTIEGTLLPLESQ